jgi:murein DD-endopeptidase MepM/ murein hydrolase activator NlpD
MPYFWLIILGFGAMAGGCGWFEMQVSNAGNIEEKPRYLRLPIDGTFQDQLLTDNFVPRLLTNEVVTLAYDFHRGIDFFFGEELRGIEPIYSVADGTVNFVGEDEDYPRSGLFVVIQHDLDPADFESLAPYRSGNQVIYTNYLHLEEVADEIELGSSVAEGQLLGYVGDSGENINSVHLHFNIQLAEELNVGEIPSFENNTLPPLLLLDYPDTTGHTIRFVAIDAANISSVSIELRVEIPKTEIDLVDLAMAISSTDTGLEIFRKNVNFALRTNCGTDEAVTNQIEIAPDDFAPATHDIYGINFTFNGIDLSEASEDVLAATATATDLRGNVAMSSSSVP